ncbi:hypothetical protein GCM10009712_25650 [Pseudarthrobacter sulfonivorans]
MVKLVQAADAGALAVALGEPDAVSAIVGAAVADVAVEPGLPDVAGGPACGPQPANSRAIRTTVGIAAPLADGPPITPSSAEFGP